MILILILIRPLSFSFPFLACFVPKVCHSLALCRYTRLARDAQVALQLGLRREHARATREQATLAQQLGLAQAAHE